LKCDHNKLLITLTTKRLSLYEVVVNIFKYVNCSIQMALRTQCSG